jgi:hypothetical protein
MNFTLLVLSGVLSAALLAVVLVQYSIIEELKINHSKDVEVISAEMSQNLALIRKVEIMEEERERLIRSKNDLSVQIQKITRKRDKLGRYTK